MAKKLAVALMVSGCAASAPAQPISPTHAVVHIDIAADALASELRTNVDALANHYVRGSFAFNHKEDTSHELSADAALDAAHKLGQMLTHPNRSAVTCLARSDGGAVCSQLGGWLVTLLFTHDDTGLLLQHALITVPPDLDRERDDSTFRAKPLTQPPMILFP